MKPICFHFPGGNTQFTQNTSWFSNCLHPLTHFLFETALLRARASHTTPSLQVWGRDPERISGCSRSHRLENDRTAISIQVVALLALSLMLGSTLLGGLSSWLLQPGLTCGFSERPFFSVTASLGESKQGGCIQIVGEVRGSRCVPRCKCVGFALQEIKNCRDLQTLAGRSPGGSV